MQSPPHSELDVIVVESWSEVDGAEDSLLPLMKLLTLSEPEDQMFIIWWIISIDY